ncbi:hypothetical protein ABPG74_003078 [Tetrahymena malaccensis]
MSTREELARSILETERDIIAAVQKSKAYENSISFLKRNIMKGQITLRELESVAPEQKAYRPLGRAFILKSKEDIKTELEGIMKSNENDIQEYEKSRQHFVKKREDLEKVFKENLDKHKQLVGSH